MLNCSFSIIDLKDPVQHMFLDKVIRAHFWFSVTWSSFFLKRIPRKYFHQQHSLFYIFPAIFLGTFLELKVRNVLLILPSNIVKVSFNIFTHKQTTVMHTSFNPKCFKVRCSVL